MNQMTNGDNVLTVEERLANAERLLDEYETGTVGLSQPIEVTGVEAYINMNIEQLRRLSPREICEAAYLVGRESLHVQREYNRQQARVHWADFNLDFILAKKIEGYGEKFTPYQMRRFMAIRDDSSLFVLQKLKVEAQLRVSRLEFIANQLRHLSSTLQTLSSQKRNE